MLPRRFRGSLAALWCCSAWASEPFLPAGPSRPHQETWSSTQDPALHREESDKVGTRQHARGLRTAYRAEGAAAGGGGEEPPPSSGSAVMVGWLLAAGAGVAATASCLEVGRRRLRSRAQGTQEKLKLDGKPATEQDLLWASSTSPSNRSVERPCSGHSARGDASRPSPLRRERPSSAQGLRRERASSARGSRPTLVRSNSFDSAGRPARAEGESERPGTAPAMGPVGARPQSSGEQRRPKASGMRARAGTAFDLGAWPFDHGGQLRPGTAPDMTSRPHAHGERGWRSPEAAAQEVRPGTAPATSSRRSRGERSGTWGGAADWPWRGASSEVGSPFHGADDCDRSSAFQEPARPGTAPGVSSKFPGDDELLGDDELRRPRSAAERARPGTSPGLTRPEARPEHFGRPHTAPESLQGPGRPGGARPAKSRTSSKVFPDGWSEAAASGSSTAAPSSSRPSSGRETEAGEAARGWSGTLHWARRGKAAEATAPAQPRAPPPRASPAPAPWRPWRRRPGAAPRAVGAAEGSTSRGRFSWPWPRRRRAAVQRDPEEHAAELVASTLAQLEQTRQEPMEVRKGIFRDLQRQLHPDKNAGCEEAAKRAFQTLMEHRVDYLRPRSQLQ